MSSKGQHVQDNSVAERRLRPIYDWLDIGNNKKALQECDKVLKKTPNLQCAKALKALTLHRIGKEAEAANILDALTAESPTDDATLQAMTLCYRELQQLEKICKLYETAVKLDPTNEELFTHLFMSYARIFDFKSQQKTAMTLYKHKPKTPYYCWAVMSIILQATRGEGKDDLKKRKLLLSLAERMMEKLIVDGKLDADQEVQLYIMVLELQEKYEEIMVILEGPLGTKLACSNPPQNRLKYLLPLTRWDEINLLCKGILMESVDRWDIWKEYINSVFELMAAKPCVETNNHDNHDGAADGDMETVDDTPEKCHEFICRIVENGADNGFLLRGPYLARFELCSKLVKRNVDASDVLGETIELFIEYFRKFGHKPCCVSDLRLYLNLLDGEKKAELSSRLIKDVGISSTSVPQSEQQMQRHLCALQLSRLCGAHRNLTSDHLKALVTAFSLHYEHGYQTYGTDLLSTDLGPSDPYALLAAHVLYDLSRTEQSSEPIIAALVLLENMLKNSPSNFHAKLLSVRLYHTVGTYASVTVKS
jgi:N-terminal acetyltransferase B complex non-catalytic subunit